MHRFGVDIPEKKRKQLEARDIRSDADLLSYYPRTHRDYSHETGILGPEEISCLRLKVAEVRLYKTKTGTMVRMRGQHNSGVPVDVLLFNQLWMHQKLSYKIGAQVWVAGKVQHDAEYNSYTIAAPEIFWTDDVVQPCVYPVYRKIPGMSNDYLWGLIKGALSLTTEIEEPLPEDILHSLSLPTMGTALRYLHAPKSMAEAEAGQKRVIYNELIRFALKARWTARETSPGSPYNIKTLGLMRALTNTLPYELTGDQKKTVNDLIETARQGRRINALIQGDVGSGKTIVCFLIMAAFAESGYQAVLMAPTKVLAEQHYKDAVSLFEPLGVSVAFLDGSMKKKDKTAVMKRVENGSAQIIIGTQSVISESVKYKKLALAVVDEEHKFGVEQRTAITKKASEGVHSITMSATPIPRSLAGAVYGDLLSLYQIKEKPKGRKPIVTGIAKSRDRIYRFVKSEVGKGHQIYVVNPMIDRMENSEGVKSIRELTDEYRHALEPYGIRIASLTGRTSKEETERIIGAFASGDIDVLVSTTVIEVGVNVPNATGIIISNAERFGLSSLHQLRGRVGRGDAASYCVLETDSKDEKALHRLKTLCDSENGFDIADEDLRMRGEGDPLGVKQSGDSRFVTLLHLYPEEFDRAKTVADEILDRGFNCCKLSQELEEELKGAMSA